MPQRTALCKSSSMPQRIALCKSSFISIMVITIVVVVSILWESSEQSFVDSSNVACCVKLMVNNFRFTVWVAPFDYYYYPNFNLHIKYSNFFFIFLPSDIQFKIPTVCVSWLPRNYKLVIWECVQYRWYYWLILIIFCYWQCMYD